MAEFYNDIHDCSIDAYHKCVEEKDLKFLVKKGKFKESYIPQLDVIFQKIDDQKIDEFGVSPEFELYYYKLRDLNKLEIKALEGDESVLTRIDIMQREMKRMREKGEDGNIRKYHSRLHRAIQTHYQGRNSHELTVFEFYNDINDLMEDQEKLKMKADSLKRRRSG